MSHFTHIAVGTNDIDKARTFYDAVLAPLGMPRLFDYDGISFWGSLESGAIMVGRPVDGQPATRANGGTIGLAAPNRAAVHSFHAAALENGGSSEGAPGPRTSTPHAYGAYVRDPDGNKFCAYSHAPE